MSREFGSCQTGYFWAQMENAAEDCRAGGDELTRLWGRFFEAFAPVAYAIASSEAGDSAEVFPILTCLEKLSEINESIRAIEKYLRVFKDVSETAIMEYIRKQHDAGNIASGASS